MPYRDHTLSIDFDFIDHRLVIQDSLGQVRTLALVSRSVADFFAVLFAELAAMGVRDVAVHPAPQECPVTTPIPEDTEHCTYDAAAAQRFFRALSLIEPVFQRFRAGFRGKCSPVHFFWGSFDLAVSRFNGRRAPARKGLIERVAYDEEVSSLGFWPGDPWKGVPEPAGFASERFRPDGAFYSDALKECLLPYEVVRSSADPGKAILDFAQSTYDAGSTLAKWDRAALAYP
jgi:hypothetical protein